jgi:hypothetical protein
MVTSKTAKSPVERLVLEGIPEGLSPEEVEVLQKLQSQLVDFVLHLIQAFLRTGYYTSEHPEALKAREGLYFQFKSLFKLEDDLTFMVREEPEGQNILVEGVLPDDEGDGRTVCSQVRQVPRTKRSGQSHPKEPHGADGVRAFH